MRTYTKSVAQSVLYPSRLALCNRAIDRACLSIMTSSRAYVTRMDDSDIIAFCPRKHTGYVESCMEIRYTEVVLSLSHTGAFEPPTTVFKVHIGQKLIHPLKFEFGRI